MKELIDASLLGQEARDFVESKLCEAMLGLAAQEVTDAQDKLLLVHPKDEDKIRELQNQAWLGNKFKEWLEVIIDKGDSALAA